MLEGFSAKGFTDDCEQSKTGAAESVPFAGSKWAESGKSALGLNGCKPAVQPSTPECIADAFGAALRKGKFREFDIWRECQESHRL